MVSLLFKILDKDARSDYGDAPQYHLPQGRRPGAWMPEISDPRVTARGYHLTTDPMGMAVGRSGPQRIFLAEYRGKISAGARRVACESVRLVREITPDWELLPAYPEMRALLVSQWRAEFGPDAPLPEWADLSGFDLYMADLRTADLRRTDLRWTDLHGANLREADLSGANLYKCNLSGARLYRSALRGANLRKAKLNVADLRKADFRGADLHEADLRWADLSEADLGSAKVSRGQLQGARRTESTCLDGAIVDGTILSASAAEELRGELANHGSL
jgi:hypothetical protein